MPEMSLKLLVDLQQVNNSKNLVIDKAQITSRELECLSLLLENKTAKEVALQLSISHRTVEHHYNRLRLKLELNSKKQLQTLFNLELGDSC